MSALSRYRRIPALDEVNANKVQVSAVPCALWHGWVHNPNSSVVYLQVWDALAANVTVGTTPPSMSIPLAAGYCGPIPFGHQIHTGLTMAATANVDGSGSALTSDLVVHLAFG